MATVKAYDPKKVILAINGVLIGGYIDGEKILVAREVDNTTDASGTDGEITVVLQNDARHTVTVALAQSSTSNDYLSTQVSNEIVGLIVFAFSLADLNGTTFLQGTGWVQRVPDFGFSKDVSDRSWAIRVAATGKNVGGSAIALPLPT